MKDRQLRIVPAGAGSGKTHRIQEELTKRIKEGLDPGSIVAVTFTETAAAELRGRIRGALVKAGMLDKALGLDQAYISTIHGFGLRLITEFAFDGGISPSPRKLSDDEQSMLISRALSHAQSASPLIANLERFGYQAENFGKNMRGKSAEQVFREKIVNFIATLRSIGRTSEAVAYLPEVDRQIREIYGPTKVAAHLKDDLLTAIGNLLEKFPRDLSGDHSAVKSAADDLRADFSALHRASKGKPLDYDWKLWKSLGRSADGKGGLRVSNRNTKLPTGYDDLAEEVMSAAQNLPQHPGPLDDALLHASLFLQTASECLEDYAGDKKDRGLLDFADMLAGAYHLLHDRRDVLATLKERIGCLVIDEFQDTNPLQFSLLWQLTMQGVPTIIVGDQKQAIMGFQNADARLMDALCNMPSVRPEPLEENWRSSEKLMAWINRVGDGLFGGGYTKLKEPKGEGKQKYLSRMGTFLEAVDLQKNIAKVEARASHVVARIHELINDDSQEIFDKKTGDYQRLKPGHIAVICPTRSRMADCAAALRSAGIRCRLEEECWFGSRVVQLACQALAYLADPGDRHAKLYLAVTELGDHTLQSALKIMVAKGDLESPGLYGVLETVAGEAGSLQVHEVLAEVVRVLDLYGMVSAWEDAAQARANLLRLQEECREFGNANREALACGGYYGSGVKTFLAWLRDKVERDDRQPEASVLDEGAVQIVTWHGSKGREWPVVAVCGMDAAFAPRLPSTRVEYDEAGFENLDAILEQARVEIFPDFVAEATREKFIDELADDSKDGAIRLLYVALTRAREKLILEWPSNKAPDPKKPARKKSTYWELFVEKTGATLAGNTMTINGEAFNCLIKTVSDREPWVISVPSPSAMLSPIGRRAIVAGLMPTGLTQETVTPSSLHDRDSQCAGDRIDSSYGGLLSLELSCIDDPMGKGIILHRAFEVLCGHPERATLLSDAVGCQLDVQQSAAVCAAVRLFDTWLGERFSPVALHVEVPLLALDSNGSVVHGFADMVVETADSIWIVDHKSDKVSSQALLDERFATYYPQLKCYLNALQIARPDKPVQGIVFNWVSYGMVSVMEIPVA